MQFEYFYGSEAEQFSFFRIPKVLFAGERFKSMSTDAKVLYGLMLDRIGLSVKNRWLDDENRVYIIYTMEDIIADLGCARQKASKLLDELDKSVGLIERKRQGLGKPNVIYVKNFTQNDLLLEIPPVFDAENMENPEVWKSNLQKYENQTSGSMIFTHQEVLKSYSNNTNNSNTEYNKKDMIDWMREREEYERQIKENIEYDILIEQYDKTWLDEIVAIMVDVVCLKTPYVLINHESFPHEIVKNRFLQINTTHIEYIHLALRENTSKVRNIRAFLITTIYRSAETADNWISAKVRYDLKKGGT